jgi:glycosyltransferase involved in cell wall biosynthesis
MIARKNTAEILWCGRFLDWKHPDDALMVASRLKQDNLRFQLTIIGSGEMEEQLKNMTATLGITDCVTFTGSMSPERVRTAMERAGIYLMTSDRKEGWGAVVNEAMNSGCAIVASRAAGAVPYLVQDGVNGMIYDADCADALYEKIRFLLAHPAAQQRMGAAAYETIVTTWNAETAARRLVQVIAQLQQGQTSDALFSYGPCSRA